MPSRCMEPVCKLFTVCESAFPTSRGSPEIGVPQCCEDAASDAESLAANLGLPATGVLPLQSVVSTSI